MADHNPFAVVVNPPVQNSIPIQNLALDPTNPCFLHPNETPNALISSALLNGKNYSVWSRAMKMALKVKNKLQFIDGRCRKPDENDPLFLAWDRCNTMVLSWIGHSLCEEIRESMLWSNVASDVWAELKENYYEGDQFHIAQLQEEVFTHK